MGWVKNGTPELDAASNWQVIVAVTIVCTTFMILVLALRIGVRAFIIKATGADDWSLWLAAVRIPRVEYGVYANDTLEQACAIASCALNITQTQLGLGLPVRLRPQVNLDEYTLHNFVNRPMYVMASTCYKISLCASYMRIMAKSGHRSYRFAVWATIALAIGYGISFLAAILFACNPVEKSWRPRIPGTCFPPAPFYYGTTTTNLLVDVIVLVLPIPLLWRLQMNRRRKFGLILCFALGAFTTVGAVMRLVSVDKVVRLADPDEFVMWSTVEINLGVSIFRQNKAQYLTACFADHYRLDSRTVTPPEEGASCHHGWFYE
ncbi:hypothetical protein B9Z65_7905 [Elsinoe australis]|uniref:Rhodopsin domain-containing protein n=1 Tax=Elsinoe australis TaxID=40998 RepID=A0A2P8A0V6_9PEZI|nr:hypothetical protein B9Z65_7905 [Elsinoe australis]